MKLQEFDVAVVGNGLAGLTTTLALAKDAPKDTKIALIAPEPSHIDTRTTALLASSIEYMKRLEVWPSIASKSAPLSTMRIIDDTGSLFRAPTVSFNASEIDLEAFGYNVPNAEIIRVLQEHLSNSNVTIIPTPLSKNIPGNERNTLEFADSNTLETSLVIAADGRKSLSRQDARITTRDWDYPQSALVLNFAHGKPHGATSTEFHTSSGPFTQVPLPPTDTSRNRSSLVWVMKPEDVDQKCMLSLGELGLEIERKMQSMLGKVFIEAPPQHFPLSGMTADQFAKNRTALIGEAAHVFPPIGAQGFNLGLRDVEEIVANTLNAMRAGRDPGSDDVISNYNTRRTADIRTRSTAVDLLNRSLLTDFIPVQLLRGIGLLTLNHVSPLRKFAMAQGLAPGTAQKSLRDSFSKVGVFSKPV